MKKRLHTDSWDNIIIRNKLKLRKGYRFTKTAIKRLLDSLPTEEIVFENINEPEIILEECIENIIEEKSDEEKYFFSFIEKVFHDYEPSLEFTDPRKSPYKVVKLEFTCYERKKKILFFLTDKKTPFKVWYQNAYYCGIKVGKLSRLFSNVVLRNVFEYRVRKMLRLYCVGLKQEERVMRILNEVITSSYYPFKIISNQDLDALNIDFFLQYKGNYGPCLQVKNSRKNISKKKGDLEIMKNNPYFAVYKNNPINYFISNKIFSDKRLKMNAKNLMIKFLQNVPQEV